MLEVADQVDGAVAGAIDAEMEGDVAVFGANRLKRGDLHAAGENGFEVFHGQGPAEGFFVEELVEQPRPA